MDAATLYDSLFRLASDNTEGRLFGSCASLAHEAFRRGLAGDAMPSVWFEIPLSDSPRFDLHVAHANDVLHKCAPFAEGAADGHDELLNWYASEPREGGGLALAYDVGDGRIDDPAIHVNVKSAASFDAEGFFTHVNRLDATALYDGFVKRIPQAWRVWYFGVHPGRPGAPVRIDCIVGDSLKQAYAAEPTRLEQDLHTAGFTDASSPTLRIGSEIAASPFNLELQFDVLSDGKLGSTVGLSAAFPFAPVSKVHPYWDSDGEAAQLMGFAEELGVADDRWRLIENALFTIALGDDDNALALYCIPTFAKFRVRGGQPLDTKIYLQAGAKPLVKQAARF